MIGLAERLDRWGALQDREAAWQERIPLSLSGWSLLPVCQAHRADRDVLELLANWRNQHVAAFPSRFVATAESTQKWLANSVLAGDRALFLIVPDAGRERQAVGQVGVCGYGDAYGGRDAHARKSIELENIVRGVPDGASGVMSAAMSALLELCEQSGVQRQHLRVFADNAHAIRFYERLGFVAGERTAMVPCTPGAAATVRSVRVREPHDEIPATEYLLAMHRISLEQAESAS